MSDQDNALRLLAAQLSAVGRAMAALGGEDGASNDDDAMEEFLKLQQEASDIEQEIADIENGGAFPEVGAKEIEAVQRAADKLARLNLQAAAISGFAMAVLSMIGRARGRAAASARSFTAGAFSDDAYQEVGVAAEAPPARRHAASHKHREAARGAEALRGEDLVALRPHIINLRQGLFSADGRVTSSKGDVDAIFDDHLPAAIKAAQDRGDPLRIIVYAHGGLNSEADALQIVRDELDWWRANHVYPIFFIWETGLFEVIGQLLSRSRAMTRQRGLGDFADDVTDRLIEGAARHAFGPVIWLGMKQSAERASAAGGGARYVAERLGELCKKNENKVEVHAVGHSAGAIFHAHFVPACLSLGVPSVRTLQLLAPAIRVDLFASTLLSLVGGKIEHLTVFTMRKDLELADTCAGVYRKSLLYLIHYALEDRRGEPILGLEASLRADPALRALLGLDGQAAANGEVVWSTTTTGEGPSASRSRSHGGFDNDAPTMNAVMLRVLGRLQDSRPKHGFPPGAQGRMPLWGDVSGSSHTAAWPPAGAPAILAAPASWTVSAPLPLSGGGGRRQRRALCVGIDQYPDPYGLAGCVADAQRWSATLGALGFQPPVLLLDHNATRDRILDALQTLIRTSRAGDAIVFHYSGHGTQLPDADGDEAGGDTPDQDEALCPYDFTDGHYVIDDDIGAIFTGIPDGVSVTCFIDCCHSGTISRFAVGPGLSMNRTGDERARFIRATAQMRAAHRADRSGVRQALPPRVREMMREVVFSACLSTEVAYESSGQGDFTRRATEILASGMDGLSNEAFQQRVTAAFGPFPRQHPGLYGAPAQRSRPLFGAVATGSRQADCRAAGSQTGEASAKLRQIAHVLDALGM